MYLDQVVVLIPGATLAAVPSDPGNANIRFEGKLGVPLGLMLEHEDRWLAAIAETVDQLRKIDSKSD